MVLKTAAVPVVTTTDASPPIRLLNLTSCEPFLGLPNLLKKLARLLEREKPGSVRHTLNMKELVLYIGAAFSGISENFYKNKISKYHKRQSDIPGFKYSDD